MGKILVLGNNPQVNWIHTIPEVVFLQMPSHSLGENGEIKLSEFIINNINNENIKAFVFDVESISNPELCLAFAMALRLSIVETKSSALAPILFVSNCTSDNFFGYKYSSILLTGSVVLEEPANLNDALMLLKPLTPNDYKDKFVDIIKILPNAKEGRHSIANQWGADVLSRIVCGGETNNDLIKKARQSLYFKYVRVQSFTINDIDDILNGKENRTYSGNLNVVDAKGKNILLIDDEADKGWEDVLRKLLSNSNFLPIKEKVPDYESLSDNAKREIESGKYDLIFLDLRMNGVTEENIQKPSEFSGMKILEEIKKQNKGNQVIMFTASNKAWNMRALLEAGADGYYIKESPDYFFPASYSESNTNAFIDEIQNCLNRSYLRSIYSGIDDIVDNLSSSSLSQSLKDRINNQLNIAFVLIYKATSKQEFAFAYVSLEQILELISDELIDTDRYNNCIIKENGEECNNWIINNNKCIISYSSQEKDYPQWKKISSIYYQLLNGTDLEFGVEIQNLIEKRNAFIHNDKQLLSKTKLIGGKWIKIHQDIFNKNGFVRLFNAIKELTSLF